MTKGPPKEREAIDAEWVDAAFEAISAGDLDQAEKLLLAVIANTLANYVNSFAVEHGVAIKFWDQLEFMHYISWQQDHGQANQSVHWQINAYPRAYYALGFVCVKRKQGARAIEFLEQGQQLEPTNPRFILEKAQALMSLGKMEEALAQYALVRELGPYVNAHHLALVQRGRGFVLIELGQLDEAEASFVQSLRIEPGNELAMNELAYIEHLRAGGDADASEIQAVPAVMPDLSKCAVCRQKFEEGVMVSVDGMPMNICRRCDRKLTKKWWEFWK